MNPGKNDRTKREAALAEPTLLPGVCPRSGFVKLDAADRKRLQAIFFTANHRPSSKHDSS
jgi:hypothetical protein